MRTTRLAPSPTGALHLGNARTFILNWLLARAGGWRIVLRIDDLDGPRVKPGADRQAIEDLNWLGIDWDEGPIRQSSRTAMYCRAIERLVETGAAYPCICTRRETELAASAPHAEDGAAVYPGTCRGRFKSVAEARSAAGREPAIRFRVPDQAIEFDDDFAGHFRYEGARLGDFVIAKSDGTPAYQLAVVVDDAERHITDVVRGDDLLESTARQILLYHALNLADRLPRWRHFPLVIGVDGLRLAKRHGDTRLDHYRRLGVRPQRVLGLLARWCGVEGADSISISALRDRFRQDFIAHTPIIFGSDDDAWLLTN
ncbi:MAG TPA: tRNA glutamyl-Q(34) synthetase GluQRS [Tepidisphaeraceae bacterium]|nr:tRNA glutamyl-Q(34) synthetase GluQRS [Tepidisphaeraceae bacterium]